MDLRDSLQLIEMDKGGEGLGPLFEEPRRRLQDEPAFRSAWSRYQALKALAWEAAPALDERLIRQGLQASRRQEVERRLARATGSQDAARELLLKPERSKNAGLPAWAAFVLLIGAVGLGWLAFGPPATSTSSTVPAPLPTPSGDAPLAFEFSTSATAGADASLGAAPLADAAQGEDDATRKARRMVNDNLRAAAEPKSAPTAGPKPKAKAVKAHAAPIQPLPHNTATALPTAAPTPVPDIPAENLVQTTEVQAPATAVPALVSSATVAVPTAAAPPAVTPAFQIMEGSVTEASLTLSSAQFPVQALLSLPEAGAVDLRLFDMRGRLVRRYAEGEQGAGRWKLDLSPADDQGHALAPGTYYLRAITRWFSKVEAIDQR